MAISFKGAHFPPDVILTSVRWYLAYPLSTRHVEELMAATHVVAAAGWVTQHRQDTLRGTPSPFFPHPL